MGFKAANSIGWGGGGGVPFTPDILNSVYTKGQLWIPAGSLTPGKTNPPTGLTCFEPSATSSTYTVMEFPQAVESEAYFTWGFKSDFLAQALNIIFTPIWYLETASVNTDVEWEVGVNNTQLGTTLDFDNSANEVGYISPTVAVDVLTSGDSTNQQRGIAVATIGQDALSTTDWNILTFMIERHGERVTDDTLQSAFLLGMGIQFDIDFNNIAAWPTP